MTSAVGEWLAVPAAGKYSVWMSRLTGNLCDMQNRLTLRSALIAGALTIVTGSAIAMAGCRSHDAKQVSPFEPPGRDSRARIDGDTAILVNGRRVTPVGRVLRTQSYALGLAL